MKNIESTLADPNIRKFKKKISSDYWMLKLHVWAYGKSPQFRGYCVLFWSTWAIIFLSPFILLGKSVEFLVSLILGIFKAGFNNSPTTVTVKRKLVRPPDSVIILIWDYLAKKQLSVANLSDGKIGCETNYNKLHNFVWNYSDLHSPDSSNAIDWIIENFCDAGLKKLVDEINEKKAAALEKNRIRAEKLAKFNEQKQKIVNFLSPFVKPAMFLSALAVGYFPIHWIFVYVPLINWGFLLKSFLEAGAGALILAAATVGIAAIVKTVQIIVKKLNSVQLEKEEARKIAGDSHFFNKLIGGIRETFSFFYDTARLLYTKECPLIEYTENETSKIVKNKISEKSE